VDTEEEGDSPEDAEKDTEDVAEAVKESVATGVMEPEGSAVAEPVCCAVHDEEGSTGMVAECVAERETWPTVRVATPTGDPVAAADSVKDAEVQAESVARGLVVPEAQGDAVSVAEVVTVSVAIDEAVALTEGVTVAEKDPDTVLVSEPPPAPSCAELVAAADGEEEPELVGLPVNVPLPVGDPGCGFDTVAVLLGVSLAEAVKLPDVEVERDAKAEGDSLAE
jgi:hypothetical protein